MTTNSAPLKTTKVVLKKGENRGVDLNEDSVNFEILFRVHSPSGQPFYLAVADQTAVNSGNIQYQKADKGELSGTVKQDKNVYQSYFLALKSDVENPHELVVEVSKTELPKTSMEMPVQPQPDKFSSVPASVKEESISWVNIAIIIAVIGVIGLGFYWYSKKTPSQSVDRQPSRAKPSSPVFGMKSPAKRMLEPSKSIEAPSHSISKPGSPNPSSANPLLQRLKNLNL
jgi:hypothetical protein